MARGFLGVMLVAAASGLAGCAPPSGDDAIESVTSNLEAYGWRTWSIDVPTNPNGFVDSPALCPVHVRSGNGASGYMLLGRDASTSRYRLAIYEKTKPWLTWTDVGGTLTFNTKPACVSLDELHLSDPSFWNNQIAIVGKRSSSNSTLNNRFYIRTFMLNTSPLDPDNDPSTPPPPPVAPSPGAQWTAITNDVYASAPAAAVIASNLVVVGRRSNNHFYVHVNPMWAQDSPLTYSSGNWEPPVEITVPLPSGWTAAGNPSVMHIGNAVGECILVTRATNGFQQRIYSYYMFIPWRWIDGQTWTQVPTGSVSISSSSDVALEYTAQITTWFRTTAYFRATNGRIYQASTDGGTWQAFNTVDNYDDPNDNYTDFRDSPGALGSSEMEGAHMVASRRADNRIYDIGRNIPYIE